MSINIGVCERARHHQHGIAAEVRKRYDVFVSVEERCEGRLFDRARETIAAHDDELEWSVQRGRRYGRSLPAK